MVCEGKTTAQIARELWLSQHTVHSHRDNICTKLDTGNLALLTRWAVRRGIIDA